MQLVILTAIGVGGATVIGALTGFAFKHISHKFSDIVLAFAAGVMLSASILGLILPSLDFGGRYGLPITVVGIFAEPYVLTCWTRWSRTCTGLPGLTHHLRHLKRINLAR